MLNICHRERESVERWQPVPHWGPWLLVSETNELAGRACGCGSGCPGRFPPRWVLRVAENPGWGPTGFSRSQVGMWPPPCIYLPRDPRCKYSIKSVHGSLLVFPVWVSMALQNTDPGEHKATPHKSLFVEIRVKPPS